MNTDYNAHDESEMTMIENPLALQKVILQAIINRDRYDAPIPTHVQIENVVYQLAVGDDGMIKMVHKYLSRESDY